MSEPSNRSAAQLYNNPVLSDVTLKQTANGQTREYHAHKAVLCMESRYFLRAFTGNFKEATDNVMELHGDNPDHFEFLLKSIYTNDYDVKAIVKLAAQDKVKRILIPIGIYAVADKYNVAKVSKSAAEDVRSMLKGAANDVIEAAVRAHYEDGAPVDSTMGKLITEAILKDHSKLVSAAGFQILMKSQPAFGADVALAITSGNETANLGRYCLDNSCGYRNMVKVELLLQQGRVVYYCQKCGSRWSL